MRRPAGLALHSGDAVLVLFEKGQVALSLIALKDGEYPLIHARHVEMASIRVEGDVPGVPEAQVGDRAPDSAGPAALHL